MKRLLFLGAVCLLVGCSNATATYRLAFKTNNAEEQQELIKESLLVMERRLESMGEKLKRQEVSSSSGTTITIAASSKEALDALTQHLQETFNLHIMEETTAEEAEVTVEGQGSFKETGITEQDFLWAQSRKNELTGLGEARLVCTDEGRQKMKELFKRSKGKNIGIFVRGQLVSKLFVQNDVFEGNIQISGIPDPELAAVFTDDVNVGINVSFTPVP